MIIETLNSVYRLYQDDGGVVMEKTHHKAGRSSLVQKGDRFSSAIVPSVVIGEGLSFGDVVTSRVISTVAEEDDKNICFVD